MSSIIAPSRLLDAKLEMSQDLYVLLYVQMNLNTKYLYSIDNLYFSYKILLNFNF